MQDVTMFLLRAPRFANPKKLEMYLFKVFKVNFILWMDDAISKQFIYYYLDWGTGAYAKIYFVRGRSQGDI